MNDVEPELDPAPKQEPEEEDESGKMSFLEHLDELRRRLLHIIIYIGVGFLTTFYFHQKIYGFLSVPAQKSLPPGSIPWRDSNKRVNQGDEHGQINDVDWFITTGIKCRDNSDGGYHQLR